MKITELPQALNKHIKVETEAVVFLSFLPTKKQR
jgi:hypothetical protein